MTTTTKSGEPRVFPFTHDLRRILDHQKTLTGTWRDLVFCYRVGKKAGKPIRYSGWLKAWRRAIALAGLPTGRIPHDCRRTAVRNLERAGVPRSTAMAMVGHKTEAIYRRYAIVDSAMIREAAAKLDAQANGRRTTAQSTAPAA
jgi:integrase